jgi:hypothetical protein
MASAWKEHGMTKPDYAYRLDGDPLTEDQVAVLVAFVRLEKADMRSEQWKGQFGVSNMVHPTRLHIQRLYAIFRQLEDRGLIKATMNTMYRLTTRGANHALQLVAWEDSHDEAHANA